jgi:hypothetical protein
VQQGDERRDGHPQVEGDRQVDHDHDQERDQRLQGLGRDLAAPQRPDRLDGDVVRVHAELAGHLLLERDGLRAGQRLGLDFPVGGVAVMNLLHDGAADAAVGDRVLDLAERR